MSHGDMCLPNILDCPFGVGVIDAPYGGIADRYYDVALLYRSCQDNLNGIYGRVSTFDEQLFFDVLGVPYDKEKIDYYILLDELF